MKDKKREGGKNNKKKEEIKGKKDLCCDQTVSAELV